MANMASIRNPSVRLILWSRRARIQSKKAEKISMMRSINSKLAGLMPPEIAMGRARTMQILKMLLPTMLPTRRSDSPFLAAVTVVTSSGREVPRATTVSDIIRSEIPMTVAMLEAEFTTNSLPATMPARPRMEKRNDLPRVYLGFSDFLASFLFLRAREMR